MPESRPIKIIRIIDRLNIGGPAKHVVWLTAGMNSGPFQTTLVAGTVPKSEGDMSYFARESGVEPVFIPDMSRELSLKDALVVLKLLALFLKLEPDIIHTHKAKAGAAGRLAAAIYRLLTPGILVLRRRPCRVLHTFHGHIFHGYYAPLKTRLFVWIERLLARFCTDRIVVLSRQQREEINERYRIGRPHQFVIVPLGIDLGEISASSSGLRAELKAAPETVLVGTVGRLCQVKNQGLFLDAARLLKSGDGALSFHFVVIGDGELRQALEDRARQLGVQDLVTFAGFRRDAASLYQDLDIVALTSVNEGTPLTLIEAMAAGRPVVSTQVGGVPDIMGEQLPQSSEPPVSNQTLNPWSGLTFWQNGITVPSGDAAAFARALSYLASHPIEMEEMGNRGRDFVASRLSRDRLLNDIKLLYQSLLGKGLFALTQDSSSLPIAPEVRDEIRSGPLRSRW